MTDMSSISLAILTHNETAQFQWLMQALEPAVPFIQEMVVVDDCSEPDCVAVIRGYEDRVPLRFFQRPLRADFASQRNHMKSLCRGEFIFYLDPDELPSDRLVRGLPEIVRMMAGQDIDACTLPRLNILHDSDEIVHPASLDPGNPHYRVFWEDQYRLLRNVPYLYWTQRLNEYLTGMRRCFAFPRASDYTLLHAKGRRHAQRQEKFYRAIKLRARERLRNSIFKRLPWRRKIEWINAEPPV